MRRGSSARSGQAELQTVGCVVWFFTVVIVLIIMVFIGGSFRTKVTFARATTATTANLTSFEERLPARHWIGGLVQGQQPNLEEVLRRHVPPGGQIARVIKAKADKG